MNNIEEFVYVTNKMLDEEKQKRDAATNEKQLYSELKEAAVKKERAAKATVKELELAKLHAEKAQGTRISSDVHVETEHQPESDVVYVTEEKPVAVSSEKSGSGIKGFIIGAAAVLLIAGGYKLVKDGKLGNNQEVTAARISTNESVKDTPEARTAEPGDVEYNYETNEAVVITEAPVTVETEAPVAVETAAPLTTENFENLVADYTNKYGSQYNNVSTQDIIEFAAATNIDLLAEENPELIAEIAGDQTREEFLNDGAKSIGATVMNNFNVWNSTHSTEGFIRVSDIVYGEQQEKMLKIENYVDRIADAANQGDEELVNEIVHEFLVDMNSGELSKLDDGVGFAAQVDIAMIADCIARNYLNKENFDMLQILKTSEKYVSNIFTVYDRCTGEDKTRAR